MTYHEYRRIGSSDDASNLCRRCRVRNSDGTSKFVAEIFRGSSLSAQAYTGVVPEIEPRYFYPTSFPIYLVSFDAT